MVLINFGPVFAASPRRYWQIWVMVSSLSAVYNDRPHSWTFEGGFRNNISFFPLDLTHAAKEKGNVEHIEMWPQREKSGDWKSTWNGFFAFLNRILAQQEIEQFECNYFLKNCCELQTLHHINQKYCWKCGCRLIAPSDCSKSYKYSGKHNLCTSGL